MRLLPVLLIAAAGTLVLRGDDKWTEHRYGPFTVLSSAGDKPAREALNRLEQYRNALAQAIGKQDPTANWPITVVIAKKPTGAPARFALGRDGYLSEGLSPEALRDLGKILLDQNAAMLPAAVESALLDLYSTLEVDGTHVTLGAPPADTARRTLDWARLQYLSTEPRYAGRMRVFLYNLGQTTDQEPAYKNAFGKTPAEVEKEVQAYFAAGKFAAIDVNARAVKPERDFTAKPLDPVRARLLPADLLLAAGGDPARVRQAYAAAGGDSKEAKDGIALATLALPDLKAAIAGESTNPRVWFEYGRKLDNPDQARAAFEKAGKLNARWYAPAYGMSQLESDPKRKAHYLAFAAKLEPRSAPLWQALATAYTESENFSEASRAWANAERSSADPAERERIRRLRNSLAEKKADQEAAERRAAAEAKERDLAKLKDEMMNRIRQAEAKANQGNAPREPSTPVVAYNEAYGAKPQATGTLESVECLGEQAKLRVRQAGGAGAVLLLVKDPRKVAITGRGQRTFACGVQRPARKVKIDYLDVADEKMGTMGEVVAIEFQ